MPPEAFERRNRGGETPGFRDAIDRMTKQMVDSGRDPAEARKVAQQAAERRDRINNGRG